MPHGHLVQASNQQSNPKNILVLVPNALRSFAAQNLDYDTEPSANTILGGSTRVRKNDNCLIGQS